MSVYCSVKYAGAVKLHVSVEPVEETKCSVHIITVRNLHWFWRRGNQRLLLVRDQELCRIEVLSKATDSFVTQSIDRLRHC